MAKDVVDKQSIIHDSFHGLDTNLSPRPPANSAKDCKNLNLIRGALSLAPGYSPKFNDLNTRSGNGTASIAGTDIFFDSPLSNNAYSLVLTNGVTYINPDTDEDTREADRFTAFAAADDTDFDYTATSRQISDLPQIIDASAPNYLDPIFHKISNLRFVDIHNFFVPDHGGRQVTVAVGTYRKTSQYSEDVFIDRFGLFLRPWYDPAQALWSNDETFVFGSAQTNWIELTECHILLIDRFKSPNRILITPGLGFPTDYFKNWVGVFEDYTQGQDHDNYLSITASDLDEDEMDEPLFLDYFGANASLSRVAGAKLIVARSFYGQELPSFLSSYIFKLLNEIRMTSGNTDADLSIMAGFRNKTFGFINNRRIDNLISEKAMLDVWRYGFGLASPTVTAEGDDPVPAGKYQFGLTLVTDDGQETEMRKTFVSTSELLLADLWKATRANIIATDGNFIYAVYAPESTAKTYTIRKLKISDLSEVDDYTEPDSGVFHGLYPVDAIIDGTNLYITLSSPPGIGSNRDRQIVRIETLTLTRAGSTGDGGGNVKLLSCVIEGAFLYVCLSNGSLRRYTKAAPGPSFTALDLSATSTDLTDIVSDGTYLYISTGDSPAKIIKVVIATFLQAGGSPLALSDNKAYQMVLTATKLFVTLLTAPGKVVRVDLVAFTEDGAPAPFIAPDDYATAIAYDGTYLYVVLDPGYATNPDPLLPLKIVNRLDPATMIAISTFVFTNGSTDGHVGTPADNVFSLKLLNSGNFLYLNATLLNKVNKLPADSLEVDGTTKITLRPLVSPSTVTTRYSILRIYVSAAEDDKFLEFNQLKDVPLELSNGVPWEDAAYFDPTARHFYVRAAGIDIFKLDFDNRGAEISANLGRSTLDNGAVLYSFGKMIPTKTYVVGARDNGISYRNKIFFCAVHGTGKVQYDVFPNDEFHQIDLENGDSDEIIAVAKTNQRPVAIKRFGILLLTEDRNGGFDYTLITSGFGTCAFRTIVELDDSVICLDYNGVIRFNALGVRVINETWLQDLIDMDASTKEAAIAILDRENKQYRLLLGTKEYVFDIASGEWFIEERFHTPLRFAEDSSGSGKINFLATKTLEEIPYEVLETQSNSVSLHDSEAVSFSFERNQQYPVKDDPDYAINAIRSYLEYLSDVEIELKLYRNDTSEQMGETQTLDPEKTRGRRKKIDGKCGSYRSKISGTVATEGQGVSIIRWGEKFEEFPRGGSGLDEE